MPTTETSELVPFCIEIEVFDMVGPIARALSRTAYVSSEDVSLSLDHVEGGGLRYVGINKHQEVEVRVDPKKTWLVFPMGRLVRDGIYGIIESLPDRRVIGTASGRTIYIQNDRLHIEGVGSLTKETIGEAYRLLM